MGTRMTRLVLMLVLLAFPTLASLGGLVVPDADGCAGEEPARQTPNTK